MRVHRGESQCLRIRALGVARRRSWLAAAARRGRRLRVGPGGSPGQLASPGPLLRPRPGPGGKARRRAASQRADCRNDKCVEPPPPVCSFQPTSRRHRASNQGVARSTSVYEPAATHSHCHEGPPPAAWPAKAGEWLSREGFGVSLWLNDPRIGPLQRPLGAASR